jgi:20S proteasome alpha/beta subunit
MLTSSNTQFEPHARKIVKVTTSIAVMTAGDANVQQQLLVEAKEFVKQWIATNKAWIPVERIATLYRDKYIELRAQLAEKEILLPQGLTYETFLSKQNELSPDYVNDLTNRLQQFSIESVATIIAGVDDNGAHIFTVRDGDVSWDDGVGFAAIGSGSSHALSHFMLSGYSSDAAESKALLTVHQAKKKSEVSPGVGRDTDMFLASSTPGSLMMLDEAIPNRNIIQDLDNFYTKDQQSVAHLNERSEVKIRDYIAKIVTPAAEQQTESGQPEEEGITKPKPSRKKAQS